MALTQHLIVIINVQDHLQVQVSVELGLRFVPTVQVVLAIVSNVSPTHLSINVVVLAHLLLKDTLAILMVTVCQTLVAFSQRLIVAVTGVDLGHNIIHVINIRGVFQTRVALIQHLIVIINVTLLHPPNVELTLTNVMAVQIVWHVPPTHLSGNVMSDDVMVYTLHMGGYAMR